MKNLILQVGRIDRSFNNPISFKYNDGDNEKKESYPLSSFFWKNEVLNKDETEILLLYPVSLPVQDIDHPSNEFLKEVANLNIDDYLKNPNDFFQKHPHSEGNKFLVINSIGTYKKDNKTYSFYSSIEEITLQILLKLVKEYSDIDNIYIDISSGQNIYITSMINAIYRFIPYHEILHGFGQNKKLNAYIISCDPIILVLSNHSFTLSSTKFSAKAFFELPYSIEKLNDFDSLLSKINKRNFREFIKTDFPILFYSFKFSFVPLLIYLKSKEIHNKSKEIHNKWEINDLVCAIYDYVNDNKFNCENNNKKIFFSEIVSVIFSAAFYKLFCSLLKNLEDLDEIQIKVLMNEKGSVDDVEIDRNETFKQIFNQIKNIQNYDKFKSELKETIKSVDFSKLSNSYSKDVFKSSYSKNAEFNPRNFVAHYGLEKNSVEYKLISASNNSYEISIKNVDNIHDQFKSIINECQKY